MIKLFLPCEEANHVCNKGQYKEASFLELIKLKLHLLYCNACKKHSARNTKLTEFINKENSFKLTDAAKKALKTQIEKQLEQ